MKTPTYKWVLRQERRTTVVVAESWAKAYARAKPEHGRVADVCRADCAGAEELEGLGSGTLAALAGADGLGNATLAAMATARMRNERGY